MAPTLSVNFYRLRALCNAAVPKLREGASIVNIASIAGYGWRANLDRVKTMVGIQGFSDVTKVVEDHGVKDEEGIRFPRSFSFFARGPPKSFQVARHPRQCCKPGSRRDPDPAGVLGDARVNSDVDRVGRAGRSEDIAPVVLFLCSDAARWINGANIPVDGGLEDSVNAEGLGF